LVGDVADVGVPDGVKVEVMVLEAVCWSVGVARVGAGIEYIK
jgi:hypothetical protein